MIWATIATILVGLGTSAEQSRAARLLGSEVPAKRKLRSDNLINDNKEERTPEKFGIEDFFADKIPETIDEILSSVPHQHSDPAVPAVAKFHPPPHQHSDGAVSTVSQQPVLTFDEPFKYSHERSDYAVFTLDTLFLPPQQGSDAAVGPWTHLPMFTFDEHYLSPHQHSDAAVSTVPHQYPEAAVPTIDDFHVPYNDVKGQLDIVYKYVGFTKAEDRHAQWLKKNTHPTKVFGDLKFLPGNNLLVQIPTFRWIYYVDQYNKKNPLHPIKLLGVLKEEGYDEEAVIKSVCFPNMDKEVIAQTSGMVQVQHIGSRKRLRSGADRCTAIRQNATNTGVDSIVAR
ncbi:unnamed protein product [Peronospora farinosa]|uniref:Uncharacterized protein n=2 Tax=Peronospora farinosa TaxID=134698 RepID=A0ABN8CBU7_9STRA|nr:unnamed protein product [Peronospora farinosa]